MSGAASWPPAEDSAHGAVLALSGVLIGQSLAEAETDQEKRRRAERVLARRKEAVVAELELPVASHPFEAGLRELVTRFDTRFRKRLLIELYFADPFEPYKPGIDVDGKAFDRVLADIAERCSLSTDLVATIRETAEDARKPHRQRSWKRAAVLGLGAAVAFVGMGAFAAPAIAAWFGAAGLTGAAAVSSGLAAIGGGSLAGGGMGMAGGLWILTGASAGIGGAAGFGVGALLSVSVDVARAELVKLQVTYKLASNDDERSDILTGLADRRADLMKALEDERSLNEKGAPRVQDLEQKITAVEAARKWMMQQV